MQVVRRSATKEEGGGAASRVVLPGSAEGDDAGGNYAWVVNYKRCR